MGKIDEAHLPAADKLTQNVKHFLGYYLIKQFDVLNFLEDTGELRAQYSTCCLLLSFAGWCSLSVTSNVAATTGTYIEGMVDADDEPDVVERKWLRPLYEAAPTVVHR